MVSWKSFLISLLLITSLSFFSCKKSNSTDRILLSDWEYASKTIPINSLESAAPVVYSENEYKPFNITNMNKLATLIPGERGYITIKTTFTLPSTLVNKDIALYAGKICIAARVFVNGTCIGTRGRFPPDEFCGGTGTAWYYIPENVLHRTGSNELSITIWVEGNGGITSLPFIGSAKDVEMHAKARSFIMSEMNLLFTATTALICFFYLLLFFRWIQEKEYLWYALTNIGTAFYLFPFFQSDVPWLTLPWSWLLFNKIFSGVVALITAYFATTFIRTFLKKRDTKIVAIVRLAMLVIPSVWILLIPDYHTFWHSFIIIFICIALQMTFAVSAVIEALRKKQSEILSLLFGFSPVLITVAIDIVIQGILRKDTLPFFTVYGWQATIALFLVILVDRFNKMRERVAYLNIKLESEVEERTRDLTAANKKLEEEQHRAEQDMDLAVHVQQSFYPSQTQFPGWDIAICFKPLSGISGDLYDLYQIDGKLRGLSLFDVSGHGIAAGLVTMLTKSVFYRTFKNDLSKTLSETLMDINSGVIAAKGKIENYLTGVLFRYDEKNHEMQLVNAGSPQPIFHRHDTKQAMLLVPRKNEKQCGMIGIPDLAVSFPITAVPMEEGDCLVCYTDGLTEAVNDKNEQFGKDRLMQSFAAAGDTSADGNLKKILADLQDFTGNTPLQDDVTIIVLKKVKEPEIEELESI